MITSTVLVTGGAGYIGSHACKALARAGYLPVTYDNLSIGHRDAVRWGPLVVGDLCDPHRLNAAFRRWRPVAVMHFAALSDVGRSSREPMAYYRNNVTGTLNLVDTMLAYDVQRLVFSSTCATYGEPDAVPIPETQAQRPINPYGRSKLMVETLLRDACAAHGLSAVALRYFNAAGADASAAIGERHDPETHLIPLVLQAALDAKRSVKVFGTDYETADGTCIRDYLHVDDLAHAHVLALEAMIFDGLSGFTGLNLGTGRGISVREVIAAAERITGRNINVTDAPRREGDAVRLVADARRATELLGWRPEFSDLDTMIATAWAFLKREAEEEDWSHVLDTMPAAVPEAHHARPY